MSTELNHDLKQLAEQLQIQSLRLVTAESCTGGWIAKCLTDLAGSSRWYQGGVVTYSNALKQQLLGVSDTLLQAHGAVSAEVAAAMAEGALQLGGDIAVAVTGIAGPGGGAIKPVGLVYLAVAGHGHQGLTTVHEQQFSGDRRAVRQAAVDHAIHLVLERIQTT